MSKRHREGLPMMPPPGGVPPQVLEQMQQAAQQQPPPGAEQTPDRSRFNPLPPGPQGNKILRGLVGCELADDAKRLEELMTKVMEMPPTEEGEDDLIEALALAIARSFRAEKTCIQHLSTRTAAIFEEDEDLNKTHHKLHEVQKEIDSINTKLGEKIRELHELTAKRWGTAVEKFGLNPADRSYQIDEKEGKIEQIDLKCNECKGRTIVRKTRQEIAEKLMRQKGQSHD